MNFRDLGGYEGADGRTVRWKMLYRSGSTHALTADDIATLEAEGIQHAYDLRSNQERRGRPSRLTDIRGLDYRCRDHEEMPGDVARLLGKPNARAEHSREFMISFYRGLPYELEDAFRALFRLLSDGHLPLVFNCAVGKDRTGAAAALVLTALGVARESVLEDYLLTEQFFERSCAMLLGEGELPLLQLDRALWEPLMRAEADYLNAMFDRLNESHGSVDRYFEERLGLDAETIERIRARLLC